MVLRIRRNTASWRLAWLAAMLSFAACATPPRVAFPSALARP